MRYYRVDTDSGHRLIARDEQETRDLTGARPQLTSLSDLANVGDPGAESIDDNARRHFEDAPKFDVESHRSELTLPVHAEEVWAAGVTYHISEEAREAESSMPEMYLDVYDADRPELFFKATPSRTVGPGESIGVRADSDWDTPEPELGVVLYRGATIGYTIGNDVSSRDIEGQNPLYLPQAKVYDRCCSLGPCVASTDSIEDPLDLEMSLRIERDSETVFEDETSTAEMVRTCEELVGYLERSNALPEMAVLLTGTALVPPESFTLQPADSVHVDIADIGHLVNPVVEV